MALAEQVSSTLEHNNQSNVRDLTPFVVIYTGTVPRPRDPDFIPSQLSTLWNRCGDIWVQQQQQSGLLPAAASALLPDDPAAAASAVDWPWRPRDLEALLMRFNLLVDTKRQQHSGKLNAQQDATFGDQQAAACAAAGADAAAASLGGQGIAAAAAGFGVSDGCRDDASVLTYEGFLGFWEGAGLRHWLSQVRYETL